MKQKAKEKYINKIVLDLETQKTFEEVGGRQMHLLKISVVGIYHYPEDKYMTFEEKEIPGLEEILKLADLVIGFNIKRFDFLVLEPYLSIPARKLPALDIMEEITRVVGHRVSLDSVAQATLGMKKSGSGLEAVRLFREGRIEALKRYCLDDVKITKELYEYGQKHAELSFTSKYGSRQHSVPVNWAIKGKKVISDILQEAFNERKQVEIEYISSRARQGENFRKKRRVDIYSWGDFYFEAFCHLRNELRTFRIDRVLKAKIIKQNYTIPDDYVPRVF